MGIVQKVILEMIPTGNYPVIHVNQRDIGTGRLVFDLKANGASYTPSGSAVIQGATNSGSTFSHSANLSGSTATATLYEDMTDSSGQTMAQIVLTEGDNITGSQTFILKVQKAAI